MAKTIITTTHSIERWEIREYYPPISSNVVIGTNIFCDITAVFADFFGGRSRSYERRLNNIYKDAINTLEDKVRSIGANAIIGLKIDLGEVSGNLNSAMKKMFKTGTRST